MQSFIDTKFFEWINDLQKMYVQDWSIGAILYIVQYKGVLPAP